MVFNHYVFWLFVVSLLCWGLERARPWRPLQRALRAEIGQDFFWLVWNGHFAGVLLSYVAASLLGLVDRSVGGGWIAALERVQLLGSRPLWVQFLAFLVAKDFVEWCIHNLLHRVGWLWEFHKLHHSIRELDWIGNMRFHWMEIVVYKGLSYLPLVLLGVDHRVVFAIAIVSTLVGHLNHANLDLGWGPLGYVLNSPRFHVWHHDVILRGRAGQNFAIVFTVWDWLFGTAHLPAGQPARLGFEGIEAFPRSLPARFVYPFWKRTQP